MNKKTSIIIGVVLVVAMILVAVGYAVISNRILNISGQATGTPNPENFKVKFTKTQTDSNKSLATAELHPTDELKATMNVQGLTAKGDKVTATYTILNNSEDLSAKLSATTTNDNETYFTVTQKIADPTTITAGNTTTIEVTVELIKTPVTADETATIGVEITAEPQQP